MTERTVRGGIAEPGAADGARLLVLRGLPGGAGRESAVRLLDGAGRSRAYVRACCEQGEVFGFAAIDAVVGAPEGALVSVPVEGGHSAEVRIVALTPGAMVVGAEMLSQFADVLRARGCHRLLATVSDAELGLMGVLLDAGFRFLSVDRDGCTTDRGFASDGNGRSAHRDLVWFELDL